MKPVKHLTIYFVIAYVVSWIIATPIILKLIPESLHSLVAFGPAAAAILVSYRENNLQSLVKSIGKLPSSFFEWLLALSPLLLGTTVYLCLLIAGIESQFDVSNFFLAVLPIFSFGVFEEIGWRGYALERLEKIFSPFTATLILAVLWTGWHIPMFFYRFEFGSVLILIGFFITIFFGAILLTSTYNLAKASTLSAIIFHTGNNFIYTNSNELFMSIYSTLIIILAIAILFRTKGRMFYQLKAY